ncbi:hypothetical protein Tco_0420801 [Tanacetum coccineum]
MASTQASSSNPSKKIKLTIIPPRKLFFNLSSDEDASSTPSPITTSSSSSPPNAPLKTPSTKDTSSTFGTTSSSFESKPQSSPPTSNDTPSPQPSNPFLKNLMDAPPRPSHLIPLQSHPSLDITLSLGTRRKANQKVSKKKSTDQSQKLKCIELLSDAAQLEINIQKAIKARKHESRLQHQSGGSSEGVDKSKAQDDLDDWGFTDDETFLFDDKDEKVEDISWVSTNEDESDDDDEEDDESVDIKKTNDEKTDTDVEDHVMGVAKMNIVKESEEENAKKVKKTKGR